MSTIWKALEGGVVSRMMTSPPLLSSGSQTQRFKSKKTTKEQSSIFWDGSVVGGDQRNCSCSGSCQLRHVFLQEISLKTRKMVKLMDTPKIFSLMLGNHCLACGLLKF